jgi:chromosome segregation ATPase
MEFEQLIKRIDWLEKERQKEKGAFSSLEEQIASMETSVNAISKQIKTLSKQVSEIGPAASRLEQFEDILAKQRADFKKMLDENEKRSQHREADAAKNHQSQLELVSKEAAEFKKGILPLGIKKIFKESSDEMQRMSNNLADMKEQVQGALTACQTVAQTQKLADDARKQDIKRIADVQGEVTAMRKRVDETREKNTLHADNIRNMENRINELLNNEMERRQTQANFLEQQARAQFERDRDWKDWREKYENFIKEAATLDTQVQSLEDTLRAAKKTQEAYVELNTKLERRISEVTEMQRLAEDRLRQEWVTFKADDQKRWTGYTISSEESMRDIRRDLPKFEERLTLLNDAAQILQDQLHQTTDTTEKQLQELMNIAHEWITSYQRIMGHGKAKKAAK